MMIFVFLRTVCERFLVLLAASVIIFVLLNLLPGDPATVMLGLDAQPESIAALHRQLGLDSSLTTRYLHWIGGLCTGHAGNSYIYDVPVWQLIRERFQSTLPLIAFATGLSLVVGLPVGAVAATYRGSLLDLAVMSTLQTLKSIPDFWLAMMMTLLFSLTLHWFPASGFPGWKHGFLGGLRALFLPAVALAIPQAAITARFMRSSLIDTLSQDYIRTARAQGYGTSAVLWRVAMPNAFLPILTLIGIQIPVLVTGAIIVESVFNIPGCGQLLLEAVNQRDIPIVQNLVMLIVAGVLLMNLALTGIVGWLDPRLAETGA